MMMLNIALFLSSLALGACQDFGILFTHAALAPVVLNPKVQRGGKELGGSLIDESQGGSDYHFSWLHDGNLTYDWESANQYCADLGEDWDGVSIETDEEDEFISSIVEEEGLSGVWTGGLLDEEDFTWPSGESFVGINWSPTGGLGLPQPDNREGDEYCLAVLNDIYNDGTRWHDVACSHEKPIICERNEE